MRRALHRMPDRPEPTWVSRSLPLPTLEPLGPAVAVLHSELQGAQEREQHLSALMLADWRSYTAPDDRVSYPRLRRAAQGFPEGFRSWWLPFAGDHWEPVGYSGWHPISSATFEALEHSTSAEDRDVPPEQTRGTEPLVYLFNYSVAPFLRGSETARRLLRALKLDIKACKPQGLAAITVSADGERVARRWGLARKSAGIYTTRFNNP